MPSNSSHSPLEATPIACSTNEIWRHLVGDVYAHMHARDSLRDSYCSKDLAPYGLFSEEQSPFIGTDYVSTSKQASS